MTKNVIQKLNKTRLRNGLLAVLLAITVTHLPKTEAVSRD